MVAGPRVLIMAGGTGGHVFPALAVAQRLRELGARVDWLGTRRGLEADVVPAAGFPLHCISVGGLRGKGLATRLLAPFRLAVALAQSLRTLWACRPAVVLGMGGFASGPGGLAAWLLRRPLVIHEQNAVPGLTNRLLSHLARVVLEAFPGSFPAARRARSVGNPLRAGIGETQAPAQRLAGRGDPMRLLVVGGSLGARTLNNVVPEACAAAGLPLAIRHQCGRQHLQDAEAAYRAAGVAVDLATFIDDMGEAYRWADLVICRAGAMTIAELSAVGVASILVPFPYAVDDHQTRNAAYLSEPGAAIRVREADLTTGWLAAELRTLHGFPARRLAMADRAWRLARHDACQQVVDQCLEVAGG